MMVLDTNTLYYACGLSSPPTDVDRNKLIRAISSAEDVVISYVTLAEFLTKYRKHARIIRRTCSYMRDNHIRVIGCEYMPMDRRFIMSLTKIRQRNLNKEFVRIFDIKIDRKCDNWYYWLSIEGLGDVLALDYYHPAVQYPALLTYYGITNIYQQALIHKPQ